MFVDVVVVVLGSFAIRQVQTSGSDMTKKSSVTRLRQRKESDREKEFAVHVYW